MRGTITEQRNVAEGKEPEKLIVWASENVNIHHAMWIVGIANKPSLFALIPARFKTLAMCTAALAGDPLLFVYVPEILRTDKDEAIYHCARHTKRVEEQKHSSAKAESSGDALASPKPGGVGDKDNDYDESSEYGEDEDDFDESSDNASSSEDDEPLTSRSAGERKITKKAEAKAEPLTSRSRDKRPITKKAKAKGKGKGKGKGPLYGYRAIRRKKGDAATPTTAAAGKPRTGIDLTVIEELTRAGRKFGKIFQIFNDPGATMDEKANAGRKMEQLIAKGDDDVLAALKILTASDGSAIEAKPGLEHVDIMQNGQHARTKQKWMSVLGSAIAAQYMVHVCLYSRPPAMGFYGRAELTAAAALDYEMSFNWLAGVAPTPSFAQGFSQEHYWINQRLAKQREAEAGGGAGEAGANVSTGLVVRTNKALIEAAVVEFNLTMKKSGKRKGADRTHSDYEAGRAAARSRHSEKEAAKIPKLKE